MNWPIDKQFDCALCGYPHPTHAPDCSAPRLRFDPLFGHVRVDARTSRWNVALIIGIGLLAAFSTGVAIVAVWTHYVVACQ